MPAHARPRPPLLGRGSTLAAMTVTVSTLATMALVHSPQPAAASPSPTSATTVVTTPVVTAETVGERLMDDLNRHLIAERRQAREQRAERRERREARAERRERRAEARAAARAAARAPRWVLPVPGAGWSASFGESGSMWSSGHHTGQDFTAPSGTPVRAAGPGTITSAVWSDAYGNVLVITHPDGAQSWYAHMTGFERTSGPVEAGDVVGYVGCTGNCYGSHLHFEYRPGGGEPADPLAWLRSNGAY